MTLLEALNNLCVDNFNKSNDWYSWRQIKEVKIPKGIVLPEGNQYLKNVALKEMLHQAWKQETDLEKKGEYIKYYITTWGGIHTNSIKSMNDYMNQPDSFLINKGKDGIASWSKALVIHNPQKYAIFDARVSASLNCIQIIYDLDNKTQFPLLSSRNKEIDKGNRLLKIHSKREKWGKVDESKFYGEYLVLLENIAKNTGTNISTVEMLLFAKAEELVNLAFQRIV